MGQFPSIAESSPPQGDTNITSFSRPSFLRPFFQHQTKSSIQLFREDTDRKDFESFVQRIFSYQSADGTLNLPENYSQSTFDSLIQSLMKQLDKYLELQPTFEQIDKSISPIISTSFTPNKIISYFTFTQEKSQPFIDFVLQLYNDLVSPKPTPENIDIFLNLFSKFSSRSEVYSPLMTSLLHHITSILLLDNESSQKLCQILINHLNSQYPSVYYVMALVDAVLMMPSLAVRLLFEPKFNTTDQSLCKPVNENITMMRARLGENAIIQSACHYQQQSFILTKDNSLYKVSTKAVKLVKLDKITSPAKLAISRRYLFVFQYPSNIDTYDHRSHLSKSESFTYMTPPNHELVCVCTYNDKILFLLFHQVDSNSYQLEYLNGIQVNVGSLTFKKPPISMCISNVFLKIATEKKVYMYEIDFDNIKIAPMMPDLLNIQHGWKLLSMQEDTFLAMKPARSHLQLAYLKQNSPLSFLPKYSPPELPKASATLLHKNVINVLINDLVLRLSSIVWRLILEQSVSLPNIQSYEFDDNFILFLVDIVKKAISTNLEMNTMANLTFIILTFILIHFNDEHKIEEKITDKIIELLMTVSKIPQVCSKTDILLTIFLIIDHGFVHLFKYNSEKLIELSKLLCSSQQTKEQFALFIPLLSASPALLYLLDKNIITILYENTSPYTTFYVIKNSFAMLIAEYNRCKKENIESSRLILTLKAITESAREYFPKEFVLLLFTFFLKSLEEMKLTTLIVSFFEFLHPTISYLDKKFKPNKIISNGTNGEDAINEQIIETKHPVGNDNKYCWDISFPGATAIEVEFDPSCSILIDDQDVFQILGGCSATSPIVYEKEPKSMEPFPKKLFINSSSARVIFRSFAGYHLHGLKMIFKRVDNLNRENEKIIDSFQFYLYYFFHCLGNCISIVFQEQTENPKMNCCQFMLWMKKIEIPSNKQICKMVPESFMNMLYCEMKTMQRIKATPDIQEIETLCISAALNQLEYTETVLNSKRFEEPANLRATTKKLSNLMLPRSPYPGNNKKPPRPAIVVPSNNYNLSLHANTIMRQSLMTPKDRAAPISQSNGSGMSTSEKVNSFLKTLLKLIYQMRTRIYYAKQKSKSQYDLQLSIIRDKAKYFASVHSVFEPVNNSDSLEVLQSRANQILRIISAEFSLNDMFSYVNEHIEFRSNQANMIKQLEKFAHKITHQHLLMQIFYPLCKRLMASSKISIPASTATAFKTLFQSLSKHFMQVDSQPDNSFQLMTLLSNFALVGFNESQSDAVFAAISNFIAHNQNTVAWQLFIHYAMNVSTKLFEDKAKYFFESGIVAPTIFLQTLLILEKGNSVTNLSFVSSFLNSKQPNMIKSVFLFLSAYYAKSGIQEEFSVKIGNKTMDNEEFFKFLLKIIGEKASGKLISLLPKEVPIESHMMIYSEITSFFRICIKKTSRVNDFLLRLFDSILLDFTKNVFDESVIGIFIILGEGFFSLKANSYAIHEKSPAVMKLEEFSPYVSNVKLQNLLNHSVVQIDKKKVIGYPRIPPCPSDFPMTKFRINVISYIIQHFDTIDDVLFTAFSLYLNVLLQDKNSLKMIIEPSSSSNIDSFEFVKSLLSIANHSSFEGQYHSMPELIEAASEYVSPSSYLTDDKNIEKLNKLVKLNSNAKVGNVLLDDKTYYYEFTLLDDMKTTNILIGFISDDCCSEYHSFAALDIQKKILVLNGIEIRGTELPVSFDENSTIGCLFNNNAVSFIYNGKFLTHSYSNTTVYSSSLKSSINYTPSDSSLPFSCHRYTPLIISSNTEIKYKVNFGDSEFKYKISTGPSQYEIIDVKYNNQNMNNCSMKSNSIDLNDDYINFLYQNSPISSQNVDDANIDFQFPLTKFSKPYFSHHKEIFESKKEICSYLKNIKGQPFIVNAKLNPFNKKIGVLHKIGKDGKFELNFTDAEAGKIRTVEFDESLLERINFHYFPINTMNININSYSFSMSNSNSFHVFKALSIRAIRYSLLHIFNSYPQLCSQKDQLSRKLEPRDMSDYLSKMLCELIPYNKEYKKFEISKGNDTIFASTLMLDSIILIHNYRIFLLNIFNHIISAEKPLPMQVENENENKKSNSIIELTRKSRKNEALNNEKKEEETNGIISNLYRLLIMEIERMNSPSYDISEYNFLIETSHPLSYTRIDRTIISHEGTHYICVPDPLFEVISRGLLIKGSINPFLVKNSNDVENIVAGNKLYLNLSNNKPSSLQYGCRIHIIPQFLYSSDSTFTPISWLLHFGTSLLNLTINLIVPKHEVNDILIPLLLHNDNKILKLFKFQLLSPILFTSQRLNEDKLYELCLPLLSNFRDKFSILNISSQEEAIILISSYIRLHSMKFNEIISKQAKTTRKINSLNIQNANNFSEFRRLMKSGQEFMKELGHKRLEFIVYLLSFLRVETLCPYFVFFKHYFEGSNSIFIIESQPSAMAQILNKKSLLASSRNSSSTKLVKSSSNSSTKLTKASSSSSTKLTKNSSNASSRSSRPNNNDDVNEDDSSNENISLNSDNYNNRYLYHFRFQGSRNQRIKFSDKIESLPPNLSVVFTSPKDPSLNIEINSSKKNESNSNSNEIKENKEESKSNQSPNHSSLESSDQTSSNSYKSDYEEGNFLIHSDDFYIEIKNNGNNDETPDKSSSIPTIKIKIIPTIENTTFPPQLISEFLTKFLSDIAMMNDAWLPIHDTLLSPHLKSSNIISALPPTSMIKLRDFPDHLIKTRFSFVKALNELFDGEIGQLPLNDVSNPLVHLIVQASSAFSSAMKLSRLEKIICKNFNQKKSFSFNRSRALLAKSNPESPEAKSLFDQVIDQIPTTSLSSLKCKDAPWRVTLEGEGATDVGGPGRDLFTEVSSEICMSHNHLFVLTPRCSFDNSIEEYVPDPRCAKSERFIYVGAFVALAFVTRLQQPYRFADLIWSYLSGEKVTLSQIYTIDPSFKTLITSVKNGEVPSEDMKFTVKNIFGEDVELIPNGASVNVLSSASENRAKELEKYCNLAIQFRVNEFNPQLKKMKEGFSIFLGQICSQIVTPEELKSYICGSIDIPIQELRQLIQTNNATPEEEEMLYEVLEEFTVAERMLFIKFATGKMSVPAPGASWNGSLNVEFVKLKPKKPPYRLPLAATCSSTVSIPRYPSKEILAEKLRTAITYGSDIVLDHAFDAGGIIE